MSDFNNIEKIADNIPDEFGYDADTDMGMGMEADVDESSLPMEVDVTPISLDVTVIPSLLELARQLPDDPERASDVSRQLADKLMEIQVDGPITIEKFNEAQVPEFFSSIIVDNNPEDDFVDSPDDNVDDELVDSDELDIEAEEDIEFESRKPSDRVVSEEGKPWESEGDKEEVDEEEVEEETETNEEESDTVEFDDAEFELDDNADAESDDGADTNTTKEGDCGTLSGEAAKFIDEYLSENVECVDCDDDKIGCDGSPELIQAVCSMLNYYLRERADELKSSGYECLTKYVGCAPYISDDENCIIFIEGDSEEGSDDEDGDIDQDVDDDFSKE